MPNRLSNSRTYAYTRQCGRCYYCNAPTWMKTSNDFIHKYHLSARRARLFQATAEHLLARQDGGDDSRSNIVAACWYCNVHRHRQKFPLSPKEFKNLVSKRMAMRRWHLFNK